MVQLCRSRRISGRGSEGPRHSAQVNRSDICEHRPPVSDGILGRDGGGKAHSRRQPFQESSLRGYNQNSHGEHENSHGGRRADNQGKLFLCNLRTGGETSYSDRGVMGQADQRRHDGRDFHREKGRSRMDGGTSTRDRDSGTGQGAELQGWHIQYFDRASYLNGRATGRCREPEIRHGSKAGRRGMGQRDPSNRWDGCARFQHIPTEKLRSTVYISVYASQAGSRHSGKLEAEDRDRRIGADDQVPLLSGADKWGRGHNKFFFLPFAGEEEPRVEQRPEGDLIHYPPACTALPPRNARDLKTLMYCGYGLSQQYSGVYQPFRQLYSWTPEQVDIQPLRRIIEAMEERQEDADMKQRLFGYAAGDGG